MPSEYAAKKKNIANYAYLITNYVTLESSWVPSKTHYLRSGKLASNCRIPRNRPLPALPHHFLTPA